MALFFDICIIQIQKSNAEPNAKDSQVKTIT